MKNQEKGNILGLLPIGVFLVFFIGMGCITGNFNKVPAIVGFLLALLVGFVQNRNYTFQEKIRIIARGTGDENIVTMCLIFLCAGAFSGAVSSANGASSTVNFGLSILPTEIAVVGLMLIGCFISLAMGTSMGTIAALAPIALGISEKTGISTQLCIGAVVCGAMFGDNLSIISDTTIAAVRTQGCEMKDKFRENFFIVMPAAILSLLIFFVLTLSMKGSYQIELEAYNLWQIFPYGIVLIGALFGINVFLVLISGTVISLFVGVFTGTLQPNEIFVAVGNGISSMYEITIISIIVCCIVALIKEYGGITYILSFIKQKMKGKKGAQIGIALLSILVDLTTANNTVAIVIAGPIAKEISQEYGISPKRSASILDIFTSAVQGLLPYGAQLLSAATLTGLTPFQIMPYLFYPIIMGISAFLFILWKESNASDTTDNILISEVNNQE